MRNLINTFAYEYCFECEHSCLNVESVSICHGIDRQIKNSVYSNTVFDLTLETVFFIVYYGPFV